MARPRTAPVEKHTDALDHEALKADSHALTVLGQQSAEVAKTFGDGLAYDQARVVTEARFFMSASAEAMLELGKRLILLKENEPYGVFTEIVVSRLGIPERTARRFMAASVKFWLPEAKRPALAVLGKTKLFELMDESDAEIEQLAEGGTIAGLDLDDMQSMTSRELRAALVEERKIRAAKDKLIASKDEKLNALAEAEHIRQHGTRDEREAAQIEDLRGAGSEADAALMRLVATVDRITREAATESSELQARQTLDYVAQRLADLCATAGLHVDLLGQRVDPAWLAQIKQAAQSGAEEAPTRARRR